MAKSFDISILGDKQLEASFRKLERKDARKMLARSFRNAAKKIQADAAALAPVDTGALRAGLKVGSRKVRGGIGIAVLMPMREALAKANPARSEEIMRSEHFYPAVVEYGAPHMAARPFLRPAFDKNETSALDAIKADLRRELQL